VSEEVLAHCRAVAPKEINIQWGGTFTFVYRLSSKTREGQRGGGGEIMKKKKRFLAAKGLQLSLRALFPYDDHKAGVIWELTGLLRT